MGPIQGAMNRLIGAAAVAAAVGSVSTKGKKEKKEKSGKETNKQDENMDAKMAAKARRIAQNKIKAIWDNAEISGKAKARRTGEVLKELGGNK